jgi:hypothetical protein
MRAAEAPQGHLETLRALMRAASETVAGLASLRDPLVSRWHQVLRRMPREDREVIVRAVEHEVNYRLLTMADGSPMIGMRGLYPNPKARLYIRVIGGRDDLPDLTRDELMRATLRAARIMATVHAPSPAALEQGTLDAFRVLSPAERDAVRALNQQMLALLDQAEREAAEADLAG